MDATVESDLCCVCFGSYQEDIDTGREWLQFSCNRWIDEDCVDDDVDSSRLCPLCRVLYVLPINGCILKLRHKKKFEKNLQGIVRLGKSNGVR